MATTAQVRVRTQPYSYVFMMQLRFVPLAQIEEIGDKITLATPSCKLEWANLAAPHKNILFKLKNGVVKEILHKLISDIEDESILLKVYHSLEILSYRGMLTFTVSLQKDIPLFTLISLQFHMQFLEGFSFETKAYQLSRFCCLRRQGEEIILETPLTSSSLLIKNDEALCFINKLSKPRSFSELQDLFPSWDKSVLQDALQLLFLAKILSDVDKGEDPSLSQWEFHDLFFHSRSRLGRHANPSGGTYPFKDKAPPLPALKSYTHLSSLPLYRPDIVKLIADDRSFTAVLESRKSVRQHYQAMSLNVQQLGEFLFRAARSKGLRELGPEEMTIRPYPSGGSLYELELYPLIYSCDGLEAGLYHYDSGNHALCKLTDQNKKTEQLLKDAMITSATQMFPQVLIIMTSRFQRRSWRYSSIAYTNTLKNVGVLMQNMYLVATAMDLAPCALGMGNSDLFAEAIQSNYFEETSVGEFMLGRKA